MATEATQKLKSNGETKFVRHFKVKSKKQFIMTFMKLEITTVCSRVSI